MSTPARERHAFKFSTCIAHGAVARTFALFSIIWRQPRPFGAAAMTLRALARTVTTFALCHTHSPPFACCGLLMRQSHSLFFVLNVLPAKEVFALF